MPGPRIIILYHVESVFTFTVKKNIIPLPRENLVIRPGRYLSSRLWYQKNIGHSIHSKDTWAIIQLACILPRRMGHSGKFITSDGRPCSNSQLACILRISEKVRDKVSLKLQLVHP